MVVSRRDNALAQLVVARFALQAEVRVGGLGIYNSDLLLGLLYKFLRSLAATSFGNDIKAQLPHGLTLVRAVARKTAGAVTASVLLVAFGASVAVIAVVINFARDYPVVRDL